jgi:serine/threonine-protein kinase
LAHNSNIEFEDLYSSINHPKLKTIFSKLHAILITNFKLMNERLPTGDYEAHFWADPSRELIFGIEIIDGLQRVLKQSQFSFSVDVYYQTVIEKCKTFLSNSGGSTIPTGMEKIELYYTMPIFIPRDTVVVDHKELTQTYNLKLIGSGSYAQVFKYKDEYYNRYFAVKRAFKNLNEKEIERFKREYIKMSDLKSPYIVEVYRYNDDSNEYIMEYMDYTLQEYIEKNNSILTNSRRRSIASQIIKAFHYIYSRKGLLHRDISHKNVLLKEYDDVIVVKISDFGLIKLPDSNMTSINTEFKGSFNDPALIHEGFKNYKITHETYALTRLIYFVMTGRTNVDNPKKEFKDFVERGMNPDKTQRFQSMDEVWNNWDGSLKRLNNQ